MGDLLNASSTLMCPHGGMVTVSPANSKVTVGGGPVVLDSDTFTIGGCAFMLGPNPHPCLQVQWMSTVLQSSCDGSKPLSMDSVGMCKAADGAVQGTVMIQATQAQVSGL